AADKTFTPATIPCSPTRTRWTFVITCAAPIDITPGKVQPGIGAADSAAPVAMMTVLLCISSDCVWVRKESSNFSIRSEERRVGKECRYRWSQDHDEEKNI